MKKGESMGRKCSIESCDRKHFSKGYCNAHFKKFSRYGNPLYVDPTWGKALSFYESTVLTYEGQLCLLWPHARNAAGYPIINRTGAYSSLVTRNVCTEVHGKAPSKSHEAAHSCGNGHLGCVTKRHLRWATPLENTHEKYQHGTMLRGEQIGVSKLKTQEVIEIRERVEAGEKQSHLAEQYGVGNAQINRIVHRNQWEWL